MSVKNCIKYTECKDGYCYCPDEWHGDGEYCEISKKLLRSLYRKILAVVNVYNVFSLTYDFAQRGYSDRRKLKTNIYKPPDVQTNSCRVRGTTGEGVEWPCRNNLVWNRAGCPGYCGRN